MRKAAFVPSWAKTKKEDFPALWAKQLPVDIQIQTMTASSFNEAWNGWLEGSYIESGAGYGFEWLRIIREEMAFPRIKGQDDSGKGVER